MDIDTDTQDGGRINHAVDANLAVVTHKEAAELQTCALKAFGGIVPQFDFAIVVLEVAGRSSAAYVAPLADNGITEEAVMSLVAVADENGVLDLAANFDVRSQRGSAIDLGADPYLGVMASGKAAADAGAFHDLDILANVDGTLVGVEHGTLDIGTLLDKDT